MNYSNSVTNTRISSFVLSDMWDIHDFEELEEMCLDDTRPRWTYAGIVCSSQKVQPQMSTRNGAPA